jgi:hypothetical protein
MRIVPLVNTLPSQSLTLTEDNDFYEIVLKSVENFTLATISRNGVVLMQGLRCVHASFLLPLYKEAGRGNFAFWNDDQNYPVYTDFGSTTFLAYYTPDELAAATV